MLQVVVHDVGDGNHIDLFGTHIESKTKIDFGTSSKRDSLFRNGRHGYCWEPIYPFWCNSRFILSHFHSDHYNGFVEALTNPKYSELRYYFNEVYYPKFPTFPSSALIMKQMVFINRLLMGDTSGSQQYDLLRYISKKNGQNFKYTPVNQGSIIRFGSAELMVLWPPDNISSGRFNRAVDTTLNRFEEFIAKNGKLRARYERMNEIPSEPGTFAADDDDQIALEMTNEKLVKEVHRINTALNDIANRISLAFIIKDSILFLGDLLEPELNEVIKHLKHSYRFNHIDCLVAAHHGTHWDNSLYDIFAYQVAISNGKRMICKFREEYKDIAEGIRSTFQEGDISIDLRLRLTSRWS